MAFSIMRKETVAEGVKRVIREEAQSVRTCLSSTRGSQRERYHEARKHLKKARAVLRLARPEIGGKTFHRENAAFRDIARTLSEVRDAQVLPATLEQLLEHYGDHISARGFKPALRYLESCSRKTVRTALRDRDPLKRAKDTLRDALKRIDQYAIGCDGWDALEGGLRRTYRQSRNHFAQAYADPTDLRFHEWRKAVKYLRHEISLLGDCWERPLEELTDQLHSLSDRLGNDHDLAVLRAKLLELGLGPVHEEMRQALFGLIERRQQELRHDAHSLGRRLFAEKPGAFVRRLGEYWDAWHAPEASPASRSLLPLEG